MNRSKTSLADLADWLQDNPAERRELGRIISHVIVEGLARLSKEDRERLKAILERWSG